MFYGIWDLEHLFNKNSENPVNLWHSYRIPTIAIITITITIFIIFKALLYLRDNVERHFTNGSSFKTPISISEKNDNLNIFKSKVQEKLPRRIVGGLKKVSPMKEVYITDQKIQVLVFYSSLAGSTKQISKVFVDNLITSLKKIESCEDVRFLAPKLLNLGDIDFDDYFLNSQSEDALTCNFYLLLLPTYNINTILDDFIQHLKETHNDFRINSAPLSTVLGYSVFGFGDREGWPTEEMGFCSQAKDVDKWMARLTGGKRAFPLGMGDNKTDCSANLEKWKEGVEDVLKYAARTGNLGEGVVGSGEAEESDIGETDKDEYFSDKLNSSRRKKNLQMKQNTQNDLEDFGRNFDKDAVKNSFQEIDFTTYATKSTPVKEMVSKDSPTYAALVKQGYTIVGSHSGVKICRWTKSALRGRGSCYKYSFYGIASHQCMETTPSLSCSNKCIFCWRHGTNPVGTTWRWLVDPPEFIFNAVKAGHYQKIKMMRGIPGVRAERFTEAMNIRHCALSLVGEPIFYPHINEFIAMLHAEHISTFLVCNAQHPDQLAKLKPVTQLYVSIDASNRESLKKIDRPLYRDFWERFNRCLDILRHRRFEQRTVFRLTLTKGFNMEDEILGYADLIEKSLPCFVEIKGVTYCGTSSSKAGATLTMQNVPFYEEVCAFVEELEKELQRRSLGYGIAAEHAHSCCVLIASERFKRDEKWHTPIDYAKFFQCLESGNEFRPEDYMGPRTPEWATWGNGGFDPRDERVFRNRKK